MNRVSFCFHAELNYFLPPHRKEIAFVYELVGRSSIKDTIEALGVPHTEVTRILVNGETVDFSYILQEGDECSVYPVSIFPDATPYPHRFILDVHLGKLANHLRMLGFDTLYRNDYDDDELAQISSSDERILLTRDIGVLKRSIVTYGYYVRNTNPEKQLIEILKRFELVEAIAPFCRCMNCNVLLEFVSKETILERVPPKARERYDEFRQCPSCSQIFWKGTHYEKMQQFIVEMLEGGKGKEEGEGEGGKG